MAQTSTSKHSLLPPEITPADLEAFHKAHFSTPSVDHFSTHFLGPVPEDEIQEEEEDDDELGYYPDGVKRTLTDEQIAMFRHSEIQALLRERRHAKENKATPALEHTEGPETEEGELNNDQNLPAQEPEPARRAVKDGPQNDGTGNAKRLKANQRKWKDHKQPPKPDLRKRTWDKVDRGLQSLDYGEEDGGDAAAQPAASQRRRISYEDV